MSATALVPTPARLIGLEPWLPWPLSAWRWWTEPVAAERLAALRIGLAIFLLIDILTTYLPNLELFFLEGGPSGSRVFAWYTQAPRWTWSLLRGLGDPLNGTLILLGWCGATIAMVVEVFTPGPRRILSRVRIVWMALTLLLALNVYCRAWFNTTDVLPWPARLFGPWQNDLNLLRVAVGIWVLATLMLLVGWHARFAAISSWALSVSFANLNPNIDNAGDVIRGIVLFYLMLSPCGAAWSVDSRASGERVISPWPLRLLFIQLIFIYFMNGLYKITGSSWLVGDSLHHVLCDVTLTRYSYTQVPLPFWATRLASWTVLVWEVGFPLWVTLPWTRKAALWFGVLFHVGIYVSMELGTFAPYALTLYLPLVAWEKLESRLRLSGRRGSAKLEPTMRI